MTHLVECCTFTFRVLQNTIPDILMKHSIPQSDPHDCSHTNVKLLRLLTEVDVICYQINDIRTPPVEPKHFVRQINHLPSLSIRELRASRSRTLRDVLRAQFLIQFRLQGTDFDGCRVRDVLEGGLVVVDRLSSMHLRVE